MAKPNLGVLIMTKKYKPPKKARENAKESLACLSKGYDAMTSVGKSRARQLARGDELSYDVVKRMYRFKRHKKNAIIDDPTKPKCADKGYVAWKGWGGTPGIEWAEKIVKNKRSKK
jgi:hypothetical protein